MKFRADIGNWATRPGTLWLAYLLVLLATMIGLGALSRHALSLNHAQQLTSQRESLEQNIRVALWRLDSRLAPYLATVHDASWAQRNFPEQVDDNFVVRRFRVAREPIKGGGFQYSPVPLILDSQPLRSINQDLYDAIPVETLVAAVRERLPEFDNPVAIDPQAINATLLPGTNSISQSLVQSYAVGVPRGSQNTEQRELDNRQAAVRQQFLNAGLNVPNLPPIEIRLAPFWINEQLVLVRSRPDVPQTFDGIWLDWQGLQKSLTEDITDILPNPTFTAIRENETPDPARALAALPIAITPSTTHPSGFAWSATHTALLLSWTGLLSAAVVAALALNGLISLSERRASFVSAVTHELRTPLTTFRLYSDLLARDMVQDPGDRLEYLQTLRREADRLTHLVDNVLRYSRLEKSRGGPVLESVHLSNWIQRIEPRLQERLRAADMSLEIDQENDGHWSTDPAALEQVLFNLIDNAAKYAGNATDRRVHLKATLNLRDVTFCVSDHGDGVPLELRATIFKPFAKTAERAAETAAGVGLGLALARQTASALGGTLSYEQVEGNGASFKLTLPK